MRHAIAKWLSLAGPVPKPVMEFDNVEAIKSVVAVGLGASVIPRLSLGARHVPAIEMFVVPLRPRAARRVGLVKVRGKADTGGLRLVTAAMLNLRHRAYHRLPETKAALFEA